MTTTSSVVKLSPECQKHYQDLRLNNKYQGVVFKINKEINQMEIEKTLPIDCCYKNVTDCFKPDECRIVVYKYKLSDKESKLIFIYYGPEKASQEDRILYSNSKVTLGITLKGIDIKIAGTKPEELTEQIIKDRCLPKVQA